MRPRSAALPRAQLRSTQALPSARARAPSAHRAARAAGASAEAALVKDFDKLEMVLQAAEYERDQGAGLQQFFDSTAGKFKTETG